MFKLFGQGIHPNPHEYGLDGTQAAKIRRATAKKLSL